MKKLIAAFLFLVLLASAFSTLASADVLIQNNNGENLNMTELFEARTFTSTKGTKINYRIFFPQDYDTQKTYPLILFLHGYGQRGSDNESQLKLGICEPFKNPNSPIYNCIVIAPQCPGDSLWMDFAGDNPSLEPSWGRFCSYNSEEIKETACLAAVAELFQAVRDGNAVDKDRVYVTGISMGGFATWDLLVRHPQLFAAAMPLCGGSDYRKASVIKDIPIWTFHGMQDGTVIPDGTIKMVSELKKIDGNIIFDRNEYKNYGHNIWEAVYKREDIFQWLLSQKLSDRLPDQPGETGDNDDPTDPATEPDTGTDTTPAGKTDPKPAGKKSSCKSAAEGIAPAILTISAAAFALRKKKKKDEQ